MEKRIVGRGLLTPSPGLFHLPPYFAGHAPVLNSPKSRASAMSGISNQCLTRLFGSTYWSGAFTQF